MTNTKLNIGLISLGCPKNLVDSELALGELRSHGYEIVADENDADILIVNTCAFLKSARDEAEETLQGAVSLKETGRCKAVIAMGCLPQKSGDSLLKKIPGIDAVVGLGQQGELPQIIEKALQGKKTAQVMEDPTLHNESKISRVRSTPPWQAYMRISDGCDIRCSFCAIPDIRGHYRSRSMEELVEEAARFAKDGVKELILIAQDTTGYGQDLYHRLALPELLEKLSEVEGIRWIRILYTYPTRITKELIQQVAENPKVCRYLDIPLQHADDEILQAMKRVGRREELEELVSNIRDACPDIAIRSSFIVGFPGETPRQFENLLDFVSKEELDWVGVFRYSREKGTPAAELPHQIPAKIAGRRFDQLMRLQQEITAHRNEAWIGRTTDVLIEGYTPEGVALGRTERQAPEVDGIAYVTGCKAAPGEFVKVRVTGALEYDLECETISNLD